MCPENDLVGKADITIAAQQRAGGGKSVRAAGNAGNVEYRGEGEGKNIVGLTPTIKCHASDVLQRSCRAADPGGVYRPDLVG